MTTAGDAETRHTPRQSLTIAEIARLAGVSAPTVSKVVNGRAEVGADTRALAGGMTNTTDLLRLADPPTAIFALNDGMAIGVYYAASQAGLRIPQDLSVIGFDDYPLDPWLVPPLTTVRQPLTDMGATAARMVLDLAFGAELPSQRRELATELVVRSSTAPPAQ